MTRHEPIRIPYYLDGSMSLVEVKPEVLVETLANAAKRATAQSWCSSNGFDFKTVTEAGIQA